MRVGTWPNAFTGTATASGTFGGGSVGTNNRGRITAFPLGAISAFTVGTLSPGQQDWKYTTYTYPASGPGSVRPHAVTGLSTGESYSYDANGNMTTRVEGGSTYTQNFDAENRLASVVVGGQTTTFVYDGDGALVKKVKPDGTSTLYLGGYEVELSAGGAVTKKTSYYPAGGAMRVDIVGGTNTVYYMLKDHLGSASVLLKPDGTIETNSEQRYYPFGESRLASADLKTAHLFTGQLDTGLGIYHFGARFFSPKLGRFISADTIVPDFANPQSLNRFSYGYNNPLKYTDPSGHDPWWCETEDCVTDYLDSLPGARRGQPPKPQKTTVYVFACGRATESACANGMPRNDYEDQVPLQPFRGLAGEDDIVINFDENDHTPKTKYASDINAVFEQYSGDQYEFMLIGHSAGADAVILSAYDQITAGNEGKIKGVVLLDPSMSATGVDDFDARANLVAETLMPNPNSPEGRLFMAHSRQDEGVDFPPARLGQVHNYGGEDHYSLAVDQTVADDVSRFFNIK